MSSITDYTFFSLPRDWSFFSLSFFSYFKPLLIVSAASTSQARTATATATAIRVEPIPLSESSVPEVTPEVFEISEAKIVPKVAVDKSALAFEDIPGPAILKLWEKYWKYVPLLGTQLLSGLLINSSTHGTTALSKYR